MKSLAPVLVLSLLFCTNIMKAQTVYETQYETVADVSVYVTDFTSIADLIVYKAPNQTYPGVNKNEGIWYFTSYQTIADKVVYFTQYQTVADLIIAYTNNPNLAGWKNPSKKKLMRINK